MYYDHPDHRRVGAVGNVKVEVTLPSELLLALNVEPSRLASQAREWILLELFHEGLISSGKAAEVLGISKSGFLQLLAQRGLSYLDAEPEELARQVTVAVDASRRPQLIGRHRDSLKILDDIVAPLDETWDAER